MRLRTLVIALFLLAGAWLVFASAQRARPVQPASFVTPTPHADTLDDHDSPPRPVRPSAGPGEFHGASIHPSDSHLATDTDPTPAGAATNTERSADTRPNIRIVGRVLENGAPAEVGHVVTHAVDGVFPVRGGRFEIEYTSPPQSGFLEYRNPETLAYAYQHCFPPRDAPLLEVTTFDAAVQFQTRDGRLLAHFNGRIQRFGEEKEFRTDSAGRAVFRGISPGYLLWELDLAPLGLVPRGNFKLEKKRLNVVVAEPSTDLRVQFVGNRPRGRVTVRLFTPDYGCGSIRVRTGDDRVDAEPFGFDDEDDVLFWTQIRETQLPTDNILSLPDGEHALLFEDDFGQRAVHRLTTDFEEPAPTARIALERCGVLVLRAPGLSEEPPADVEITRAGTSDQSRNSLELQLSRLTIPLFEETTTQSLSPGEYTVTVSRANRARWVQSFSVEAGKEVELLIARDDDSDDQGTPLVETKEAASEE